MGERHPRKNGAQSVNKLILALNFGLVLLVAIACGSSPMPEPTTEAVPVSAADITDVVWWWSELIETDPAVGSVVPNPEHYTLLFHSDGTLEIQADCNLASGAYRLDGGSLSIELGPSTMAFCGEQALDQQYLALLSDVGSAALEAGRLVLDLNGDAGQMVFVDGGLVELPPAGGGVGIDPVTVALDTMGLPYSWQANLVPAIPYDDSQPLGPVGLPEHIQVSFGADPQNQRPGDPVIYIIPVEAYIRLWEAHGDPFVTIVLEELWNLLDARPDPSPTAGMPVLPVEQLAGTNDLAVQGSYLDLGGGDGVRFVGRFVQGPNPVTNDGLHYVFQGFSKDRQYLIAFFYPVTTGILPYAEDLSADEQEHADSDLEAYMEEKVGVLNALALSDWDPDLSILDYQLGSLSFETRADDSQ
jgi:heat shock protein HslJ